MVRKVNFNIAIKKSPGWGARVGLMIMGFLCTVCSSPAVASYMPFNTNVNMNVGIGTSTPQAAFAVVNGNVGIGTWAAAGGNLIVNGGGNVGINSAWPGQAMDVHGTVRMTSLTMSGQGPANGYILIASDSSGDTMWSSPGSIGVGGWTVSGNNLYNINSGNVGINTVNGANVGIGTSTPQGGFVVTNGNVGIGTWAPGALLDINGNVRIANANNLIFRNGANTADIDILSMNSNNDVSLNAGPNGSGQGVLSLQGHNNSTFSSDAGFIGLEATQAAISSYIFFQTQSSERMRIDSNGNLGIGTTTPQTAFTVMNGNVGIGTWAAAGGNLIVNGGGNVGIGSAWPGQRVDVNGTVRMTGLTMSASPISGYVLTASDSAGDTTWSSPGSVSGWVLVGNNLYNTNSGNVGINTVNGANVGIGTSTPQGGFVVTNGNVGIGTWVPAGLLQVNGLTNFPFTVTSGGNVGIGTITPQSGFVVPFTNVGIGTWTAANDLSVVGQVAIGSTTYANAVAPSNGMIVQGNVGIGTTTPQTSLSVVGGNVGIGTWAAGGGNLIVNGGGNVGIGSAWPGQRVDVNGTVRMTGLTMSASPISGYVLTASDSAGDTTWSSPGSVGGWVFVGNNLYNTNSGNVGINTVNGANVGIGTSTPQGGFVVTNGNVGIGTWAPSQILEIGKQKVDITLGGNVGIGTTVPTGVEIEGQNVGIGTAFTGGAGEAALTVMNGNVGIGTWIPAGLLQVNGLTNSPFTVTSGGNVGIGTITPQSGFVVPFTNVGIGTWTAANDLSIVGQVAIGSTTYANAVAPSNGMIVQGNVGIGTTTPQTSFSVVGGNVGIGTWAAQNNLSVIGGMGIGSATYASTTAPSNGIIVSGNIGIGTTTPQTSLSVVGGNVGIGTWAAAGGNLIVNGGGNVGIGSAWPGQRVDVNGTVRMTGLTMSGSSPISGYVLTASDSAGDTTWSSPGSVSGWVFVGNNLYNTNSGNVGINTVNGANVGIGTSTPQGGFVVTNGNVGIGTWMPAGLLQVNGLTNSPFTVTSGGNVGIGTITPQSGFVVPFTNVGIGTWTAANDLSVVGQVAIGSTTYANAVAPSNGMIVQGNVGIGTTTPQTSFSVVGGNVGIGTWAAAGGNLIVNGGGNVGIGSAWPGQRVDVNGTVRMTGLTMSGSSPISGYVLTASDSAGDTTWSSPGSVSGWVFVGNNLYNTNSGNVGINTVNGANVGIGTSTPQGGFVVTNGNVGIGTWTAANALSIVGGAAIGSVTYANTTAPSNGLIVQGNVGIGTINPMAALGVVGNIGIGTGINSSYVTTSPPLGGMIVEGNVGIGSKAPGSQLAIISPVSLTIPNIYLKNGVNSDVIDVGKGLSLGTIFNATAVSGTTQGFIYSNTEAGSYLINAFTYGIQSTLSLNDDNYGTYAGQFNATQTRAAVGTNSDIVIGVDATATSSIASSGSWGYAGRFTAGSTNIIPVLIKGASSQTSDLLEVQNSSSVNQLLVNSSGNIGISTNSPFGGKLIVASGNVGIGSLTPGQTLDVTGTVRMTGLTMSGSSPISGYVLTASDSAGDTTWSSPGSVSGWVFVGNNLYNTNSGNVGVNTVNGANVGIGTSTPQGGFVVTNGNVGIGTWTTANALSIVGGVGIGPATYASTTAPINGLIVSGNVGIGTTTPQGGFVVINGNVGIGTWAPNYLLQVSPNGSTTSNVATIGFQSSVSGNATRFALNQGDDVLQTAWGDRAQLYSYWGTEIHGYIQGGTLTFTTGTASDTSLTVFGGTGNTNPIFETVNNVGVGTSMVVTGGGNVGLGSLWPGTVLDVNGTVRMTGLTLTGNGAAPGSVLVTNAIGVGTWMPVNTIANAGFITAETAYEIPYYNTPSPSETLVGSSNMVFNPTTGNVGLGTVTPLATLQIVGNIGIGTVANGDYFITTSPPKGGMIVEGNVGIGSWAPVGSLNIVGNSQPNYGQENINAANGLQASIGFYNATGLSGWEIGRDANSTGTNNFFIWDRANTALRLLIDPNGNVGIGTSTPQGGFVVNNGNVGIGTWAPGGALVVMNGNVGIGSTIPNSTLQVQSPGAGNTSFTVFTNTNGTILGSTNVLTLSPANGYTQFYNASINSVLQMYSGSAWNVQITPSGPTYFNGGNVGVGTLTPLATMQVVGNVGIGTVANGDYFITTSPPKGGMIVEGNVGIGTWLPAYTLDLVNNTARERTVRRYTSIASNASPAINTDSTDLFLITALAANITSFTTNLTGAPKEGDLLEIRIYGAAAQTIAWGGSFVSTTTILPATTVAGTTLRVLLEYNVETTKWECIGVT